jgi:hypothetical protein
LTHPVDTDVGRLEVLDTGPRERVLALRDLTVRALGPHDSAGRSFAPNGALDRLARG